MADRFWVGGTDSWNGTAGTKWATTSGGAGGAAVPTSADDVYFDAASGTVTCTISAGNTGAKSINCTGFTGTLAGTASISVTGSVTLVAGMTVTYSGVLTIVGTGTLTSGGNTLGPVVINGIGITVTLGDALTCSGAFQVASGTFTTNDYNVTATQLNSNNSNTRTINLGSSTVTLSFGSTTVAFNTSTNLTFNAGTSNIILTNAAGSIAVGTGATFYNVSFTSAAAGAQAISGANTFNNISVAGRTSVGIGFLALAADQTINGTLTLSAGTNATMRTVVRSDTIGTTRTLTCAAVASLTDIDFRDITIAGAAAPVSGTRLGDCKGNSGITFDAAKTVYWRSATASTWGANHWSATIGGSLDLTQFPLAQDTAIFPSAYPNSGVTVPLNAAYNIGTIDMSARTSNTMTLATGSNAPQIYGNWINGTGTTLSGTGVMTFAGRGSQTITSAGKTFTQAFTIDTPSGSVTLLDAFVTNRSATNAFTINSGTFDANDYNFSLTGGTARFSSLSTASKTMAVGSGTWTISGSGPAWDIGSAAYLTVTGTGTISLTSASAKTFAGGGIQTYPTINQGGTGTLTVTGSNKFADITNTAIGRVQFTGGTTNEFTAFNLNGVSGNLLQVGSTNTTQVTLKAPSWNVGANSTNAGNNTGLTFSAGSVDYLSISYVNGEIVAAAGSSASINCTATATANANIIKSALASISAAATVIANGQVIKFASSNISASTFVDANGQVIKFASTNVSASAFVDANAVRIQSGNSSVTANANVTVNGLAIKGGNAAITANATLIALGGIVLNGEASVVTSSAVAASGIRVRNADGSFNGSASISSIANIIANGASAVDCNAQVIAYANAIYIGVSSISGVVSVSADAMNGRNWTTDAESDNTWTDELNNQNTWSQASNGNNLWQLQN